MTHYVKSHLFIAFAAATRSAKMNYMRSGIAKKFRMNPLRAGCSTMNNSTWNDKAHGWNRGLWWFVVDVRLTDFACDSHRQREVLFRIHLSHIGPFVPQRDLCGFQAEAVAYIRPMGVA